MLSQSLAVLVAAATVSFAKTPARFEPASNTDLIVEFSNLAALNGATISKEGLSLRDIIEGSVPDPGYFSKRKRAANRNRNPTHGYLIRRHHDRS